MTTLPIQPLPAVLSAEQCSEHERVSALAARTKLTQAQRRSIEADAVDLVRQVRARAQPTLMESFLGEYGLSTAEGIALMTLAEAMLRVPDIPTTDALLADKVTGADWASHAGQSSSTLVNASTWALNLTQHLLADHEAGAHALVKRLGEPVVRRAMTQAMRELGRQFVLGRDIGEAVDKAAELEADGYAYSYDMLGEAARTQADAQRYTLSYASAIAAIARRNQGSIGANPGISVKLSALCPRYETLQHERALSELETRAGELALAAKLGNIGFNIDAEESERLELSLHVIERLLRRPQLAGWNGFGVVVQAYGRRALQTIEWLHALAEKLDRRIMVRLVKGAYWDTEIKRAQVLGVDDYPVYTHKPHTDISYLGCARALLERTERIYPQFATHNAHTMAGVLHIARDLELDLSRAFEFQRLHGMGETLHHALREREGTRCRIYAPVGPHRDLLAYLVRRLLENGANSSFVNQIADEDISPEEIARDPFNAIAPGNNEPDTRYALTLPPDLYQPQRRNARGWDIGDPATVVEICRERERFATHRWTSAPMLARTFAGKESVAVTNPARPHDVVGEVVNASAEDVVNAIDAAVQEAPEWAATGVGERAECLRRAADSYETNAVELFALAAREAGKSLGDCVDEVREAVDFLRYYAAEAQAGDDEGSARGPIVCISPWNFPLAIFTGQIAAALAAGNTVLAKPAEQTPLIAARAVQLLHEAGIPPAALQLLPGDGASVGGALVRDSRIGGVCFTGSTATARNINQAMAHNTSPDAMLIAETGGLNAMIVDSTALIEQAVRDIIASSFQSAGQRCSALRILYVQEDVAEPLLHMLRGAMTELTIGDPWLPDTDVGPVIDADSRARIEAHVDAHAASGQLVERLDAPVTGLYSAPALLQVSGIEALEEEVFGPVLHFATFKADDLNEVVDSINAKGYGLTFGLHTRMSNRVDDVCARIWAGNVYVNRNQIGAVVGTQPFGGEGLSGTGPKAGGPRYLRRFRRTHDGADRRTDNAFAGERFGLDQLRDAALALAGERRDRWASTAPDERREQLRLALDPGAEVALAAMSLDELMPIELPGPTGESNKLSVAPRGTVLCLGPGADNACDQAVAALAAGNAVLIIADGAKTLSARLTEAGLPVHGFDGQIEIEVLSELSGICAVACRASDDVNRHIRRELASREGSIVALLSDDDIALQRLTVERHVCIDTTAAGGNASLLAGSDPPPEVTGAN